MLLTPGEPLVHARLEVRQRLLELGVAAPRGLERGDSAQQQGGDRGQERGPGHRAYQLSTKFREIFTVFGDDPITLSPGIPLTPIVEEGITSITGDTDTLMMVTGGTEHPPCPL